MRFTESHEWIQYSQANKTGIVGITNYAQKELGEVVHIELPKVGQKVVQGKEVCVLESTKAASDIYAPVSGAITEVNLSLKAQPQLINQDPESEGWLFKIELSNPGELESLLTLDQYLALIE